MFDPYHKWLGIPREKQPATYYQLLGLQPGERDPEVIEEAAIRQSSHLRAYQLGPHAALCTRLLNEIAEAKAVLLHPAKRSAYEAQVVGTRAVQRASIAMGADERVVSKPAAVVTQRRPADEAVEDDVDERKSRRRRRRHESIAISNTRFYGKVGAGIVVVLLLPFGILGGLYLVLRGSAAPEGAEPGPNQVVFHDAPAPRQPAVNVQPGVPQNPQANPPQAEPRPEAKPPQADPPARPAQQIEGGLVLIEDNQRHFRDPVVSPDGRYVVFHSGELHIWDLTAKKEIARGGGGFRGAPAMSADGQVVAVPGDGSFDVWNVAAGKKVQTVAHPQQITAIGLSPDGKTVATGTGEIDTLPNGQQRVVNGETQFKNCILRHWDVSGGKMLKSWGAHTGIIVHIHITRDRILSAAGFGSFHEVELASGKEKLIRDNRVIRQNFSPDGSRIFGTLQDNRTLVIVETGSRQIVRQFASPDPTPHVCWSANGKFALVSDTKDLITLWDAERGLSLKSFAGPRVPSIALSGDGRLAVVAGMGSVRALNLD